MSGKAPGTVQKHRLRVPSSTLPPGQPEAEAAPEPVGQLELLTTITRGN